VVTRRVAKALIKKAELGQIALKDFPMLMHVNDVLDNGKDAELPWDKFTFEQM
jgi:glycerol-3-phosphate dehydrogenase (NAD(P)+)